MWKKNNKTFLQQSTVLNDIDFTDYDDPINKRISNSINENQSTESTNTSMFNNPPKSNQNLSTVCTIQECDKLPVYSQQQLKCFDPSFFSHVTKSKEFFLPPNTYWIFQVY